MSGSSQVESITALHSAGAWSDRLRANLNRPRIPGLDGIRAIAVFLVIFSHFPLDWANGAMGVIMFFVLSGFLITWLLLNELEKTGNISLKAFYKRRTFRIFPAFYAYWIFGIGITLLHRRPMPIGISIASLCYVTNYYLAILHPHTDSFLGHAWSLGVEEQFYLLWPLVVLLNRRNLARLTWIPLCIIPAVWINRAVLYFGFHVDQSYIYHAFDTRLDHLMVGCLLAILLKRRLFARPLRILCEHPAAPLASVGYLAFSCYLLDRLGFAYRHTWAWAADPFVIAIFIVQIASGTWRWLNHPVLSFLGRISYSLYLYQQLTLSTARRVTASYPVAVQLVFAVAVTIAFATASYYLVEQPVLRWSRRSKRTVVQPISIDTAAAA
ncbi:MAG: acyltransferase [Acidobacteriaceae bacterium]|nr:acyltransferase [Acidobacteriaceae bacterium]